MILVSPVGAGTAEHGLTAGQGETRGHDDHEGHRDKTSGGVRGNYDRSDAWHGRARALVQGEHRDLTLPGPVIPEVDHLLGHRLGTKSRLTFHAGIIEGYYLVAELPRAGYQRVAEITRQFADLELGFVDAAIVVLAETLGLSRVATTDRRHFAPLASALSLELLP